MIRYVKSLLTREALNQLIRVGMIGVVNTAVYFASFNWFRVNTELSLFWAIAVAFAIATGVSYVLNRRWTFRIQHGREVLRETVIFYAINVGAWLVTEAIVAGGDALFDLDLFGENMASIVASAVILLPKFAGYRDLVFSRSVLQQADPAETALGGTAVSDGSTTRS